MNKRNAPVPGDARGIFERFFSVLVASAPASERAEGPEGSQGLAVGRFHGDAETRDFVKARALAILSGPRATT